MTVELAGVEPSADIRRRLANEGRAVLLAFSRGKDSIAAYLALIESGVEVIPYHLDLIPGLRFVDESIAMYEDFFEKRILRLPHPSFYRWVTNMVFTPPERCAVIEAASPWAYEYADLLRAIRSDQGLDDTTWAVDGVRACDSPARRISTIRNGPARTKTHQISAIWDWQKADVYGAIEQAQIPLPIDYGLWNRSFDGLDHRFLAPMRTQLPDDFQQVLEWFPLADLELFRCHKECCHDYRPA